MRPLNSGQCAVHIDILCDFLFSQKAIRTIFTHKNVFVVLV